MRRAELRLLLSRIRWVNVAALLGLPAVALVIALWPRLAPSPPAVPDAAPRPVVTGRAGGQSAPPARQADARAAHGRRRPPASPTTGRTERRGSAARGDPRVRHAVRKPARAVQRPPAAPLHRRPGRRPRAPAPEPGPAPVPVHRVALPPPAAATAAPPDPVAAEFGVP